MESRTSSRTGTTRTRRARTAGRASDDLVGSGEDLGLEAGTTDPIGDIGESAEWNEPSNTSGQGRSDGLVNKVKERAKSQLTTQKDRATDGIGTLARAVRQTTDQLRNEQHETVAQYVERAAEQLERLSTSLREKDVNELLQDAQRLARRQPALFIGGSFAVGLLAARFLRSSRESESSSYTYSEFSTADQPRATDLHGEY